MAVVTSFVYGFCLCATVSAVVTLAPSGNNIICANGANISLTCVTTGGPLLWEVESGNQLFNAPHGPTSEGRFNLVVNSFEQVVDNNNMMVPIINSTATLLNFQRDTDNGIFIKCTETTSGDEKEAIFESPSINVTISSLNDTSVDISWNPSSCFQDFLLTIINSSDGSVYLNITTSDTNTTVTLPTGVEYCVTVLGVDGMGRRVIASEQNCITIEAPSLTPINESATTSTSPSVSPVVGGVNIAAAVAVPIVLILLTLIVIATVVGVILLILKKRGRDEYKTIADNEMDKIPKKKEKEYVCQVFCHEEELINNWRFMFAFCEKEHLGAVKQFFNEVNYTEHGSAKSFKLEFDSIKVKIPVTDPDVTGWIVEQPGEVTKDKVEQYTGKGEPPCCDMIVRNAKTEITPPDFHIGATINSTTNKATIELNKESLSVFECQVFYHREGINCWKVTLAFFSRQQFINANRFYQDSNNVSSAVDVISHGTSVIKLSTGSVPENWELSNFIKRQVKRSAVEAYTGKGEPPHCEMTLRAIAGDGTPPDLTLPVILAGVKKPTTITLERVAEKKCDGVACSLHTALLGKSSESSKLVCQVFYYKVSIICWKATFAFYPVEKAKRVYEIYQDANIGPTLSDIQIEMTAHSVSTLWLQTIIEEENDKSWTSAGQLGIKVEKSDIKSYTGEGKPPTLEVTFTAAIDLGYPSDLKRTIVISGIKIPNRLTIERMAPTSVEFSQAQNDCDLVDKQRHEGTVRSIDESGDKSDTENLDPGSNASLIKTFTEDRGNCTVHQHQVHLKR